MQVITRKQMMNKEATHDEYMRQFVTPETIAFIERNIGRDKIIASTDPSFNDIPLAAWDKVCFHAKWPHEGFRYNLPVPTRPLWTATGESLTRAVLVSIAKTAAKIIKERESNDV